MLVLISSPHLSFITSLSLFLVRSKSSSTGFSFCAVLKFCSRSQWRGRNHETLFDAGDLEVLKQQGFHLQAHKGVVISVCVSGGSFGVECQGL